MRCVVVMAGSEVVVRVLLWDTNYEEVAGMQARLKSYWDWVVAPSCVMS